MREQGSLYQATLDAAMADIESSEGMERRGKVLGLITALKQICNRPAQFLREPDAAPSRSGNLRRLAEELRTVFANGDAVLLFAQYRRMGEIVVRFLAEEHILAVLGEARRPLPLREIAERLDDPVDTRQRNAVNRLRTRGTVKMRGARRGARCTPSIRRPVRRRKG